MTNRSDCLSKIFVLMGKGGTRKDTIDYLAVKARKRGQNNSLIL